MSSNLEELLMGIENSNLYREYKKVEDILNKDSEIKELLDSIKELEKKAAYFENIGDEAYKEIDEEIKLKANILNNKQVYKEYLKKMEELNKGLVCS